MIEQMTWECVLVSSRRLPPLHRRYKARSKVVSAVTVPAPTSAEGCTRSPIPGMDKEPDRRASLRSFAGSGRNRKYCIANCWGRHQPQTPDRVYCAMKLNLPRRTKRRLPTRIRQPLAAPSGLNQIWALDFMADALYGGRAFRTLNLIDGGNRHVLGIEVAHSIPGLRVIRVMEQLIELHGKPRALRLDNGPELTSVAFTEGGSLPKSSTQ
jgi:transposase InsO family protein